METFEIRQLEMEGFPLLEINGYFNKETGVKLTPIIDKLLESGKIRILMDLSKCSVMSSPGVSAIMVIAMKVVEDFQGALILFGLNELKSSVLKFTGVSELAQLAKDVDEALQMIKSS